MSGERGTRGGADGPGGRQQLFSCSGGAGGRDPSGADLLRRAGGASRLLPGRVRDPTQVAGRDDVRRSVALCQFLPGPASSQVGIAIGITRGGLLGGVAAWLGFTLPSAIALVLFAYGLRVLEVADAGWLHGLKVAAVAVVAFAVWGMARSLAPDRARATIAIVCAFCALLWPTGVG